MKSKGPIVTVFKPSLDMRGLRFIHVTEIFHGSIVSSSIDALTGKLLHGPNRRMFTKWSKCCKVDDNKWAQAFAFHMEKQVVVWRCPMCGHYFENQEKHINPKIGCECTPTQGFPLIWNGPIYLEAERLRDRDAHLIIKPRA